RPIVRRVVTESATGRHAEMLRVTSMRTAACLCILLGSPLALAQNPPAHTEAGQTPAPVEKAGAPLPVMSPPPEPIGGYSNGGFFLRHPHDWFVIFPKGRLQVDWYNFLN